LIITKENYRNLYFIKIFTIYNLNYKIYLFESRINKLNKNIILFKVETIHFFINIICSESALFPDSRFVIFYIYIKANLYDGWIFFFLDPDLFGNSGLSGLGFQ